MHHGVTKSQSNLVTEKNDICVHIYVCLCVNMYVCMCVCVCVYILIGASLVVQVVKNLPAMQKVMGSIPGSGRSPG